MTRRVPVPPAGTVGGRAAAAGVGRDEVVRTKVIWLSQCDSAAGAVAKWRARGPLVRDSSPSSSVPQKSTLVLCG